MPSLLRNNRYPSSKKFWLSVSVASLLLPLVSFSAFAIEYNEASEKQTTEKQTTEKQGTDTQEPAKPATESPKADPQKPDASKSDTSQDVAGSEKSSTDKKESATNETSSSDRAAQTRGQARPLPATPVDDRSARTGAKAKGDITFDDIKFDIEKDGAFERSMLTEDIENMHKKSVRLRGYILPASVFQQTGIKKFVLVRDNQECCFGPGAALYDCVMVEMAEGKSANFTTRPVAVRGTFMIDDESYQYPDGGHYAIYKMIATEVK